MLRGYRYVIVAVLGWLFLSGAILPTEKQTSQPDVQQPLPTTQTSSSAGPTSKFTPYPDYNPDPCYHAEDSAAADLCAQWRAAIAAEKSADEARRATNWAIIATILSGAGLFGVLWSLKQTEGALREARRGNRINLLFERRAKREARKAAEDTEAALRIARANADAAKAQVEIAQNTAEKQLRAYIFLTNVENIDFVIGKKGVFKVNFNNNGQTPASEVRAYGHVNFFPSQFIEENLEAELKGGTSNAPLGPNCGNCIGVALDNVIDAATVERFKDGSLCLIAFGKIGYTDIFGFERETRYRFHAVGGSLNVDFVVSSVGNGHT